MNGTLADFLAYLRSDGSLEAFNDRPNDDPFWRGYNRAYEGSVQEAARRLELIAIGGRMAKHLEGVAKALPCGRCNHPPDRVKVQRRPAKGTGFELVTIYCGRH